MNSNKGTAVIPEELESVLRDNPAEGEFFHSLADRYKRGYSEWVGEAKKPLTRQARAAKALIMLRRKQETLET